MRDRWTIGIGIFFLCFAVLALGVWIPRDVETGIVEVFRRSRTVGDAMAPAFAAIGIAITSLVLIASAYLPSAAPPDNHMDRGRLTGANGRYLAVLVSLLVVTLAIMYWTGPALVKLASLTGAEVGSYREVRGTSPWKYSGYFLGGTLLIFGLVSFVQQKASWNTFFIAAVITIVLMMLYDLPFDSLVLPPNGDF